MPKSLSSQINFVLVRPQFGGNAGAAARAIKNCSFKRLVLVSPAFGKEDLEVRKYALGAKAIVQKAPVYEDLAQALEPYAVVVGTTRRQGGYRKNFISLLELSSFLPQWLALGKIAFLFGTEASGLANVELDFCQHILTIPANPRFESFNLSQAVLLVAFELFRNRKSHPKIKKAPAASIRELEGMYGHLTQMLKEIGFLRKSTPYHMPRILRNIFGRAHLTDPEVRVLRGICRQVLWYKNQKT